ncbi:ABC transporter permease [Paenibacillus sp. FSL K6-2524]|uniref:ABC transporter permease n=1 Tax=Paenibacillus sp. FSL K6-2524 TaxID=2954516 RepID=UPI0030F590FC
MLIRLLAKTIQIEFLTVLRYRVNYFFSVITFLFPILASYCLWTNLYSQANEYQPYSINNMLLYSIIGVGMNYCLRSGVVITLEQMVKSGNISLELTRPVSFQLRLLYKDIGVSITNLTLRFCPALILCLIIFKLNLSQISIYGFLCFLLLITFGFLILFLIDFICGLLSFWVNQLWGINFIKNQTITLLSGALIPLWILPEGLKVIFKATPFPFIFGIPIEILISNVDKNIVLSSLITQFFWIIFLFILGRVLWHFGSRRIYVQGG